MEHTHQTNPQGVSLNRLAVRATTHCLTGCGIGEVLGLVALPCALLAVGAHQRRVGLIRMASFWALAGVIVNRLNVSVIALNWNVTARYWPSPAEILISLTLVVAAGVMFRWIVNRMPILRDQPGFGGH